ncbi:MAG: hemerythrin family protein [Verrucomicrobiae bacterium]|nr:hemerythrin family protein [Verrucomicrobiae bacterium]
MLSWSDRFETGDAVIDSQHKTLIDYLNRLESIARNTNFDREEAEFILNLVDFVEIYTIAHFKNEEACMARHRCPAHQKNKDAHAHFLGFFHDFKRRFEIEGCRPEVLNALHQACSDWILQHILGIDLQLKPCLRRATTGDPPTS